MWSESQGATLSTCGGKYREALSLTGLSPETRSRDKMGHARPSQFGAVHGFHSPEPVLWEEAAHNDFIFIYQVLLLQHFLGWGQWGRR